MAKRSEYRQERDKESSRRTFREVGKKGVLDLETKRAAASAEAHRYYRGARCDRLGVCEGAVCKFR